MATEIGSAYVSLQVKMDQLQSGMSQAKGAFNSGLNDMTIAAARANMKIQNLFAGTLQRMITISRAIRRLMIVTFAPMAAITAAAFKSFSKTSNAEVMTVMGQFGKFKDTVKGRLADAFYYAVKTSTLFGKTTAEWMDVISQKLNKLTQQDVKNFVGAMKLLVGGMAILKTLEMWSMLARYIQMARIHASRYVIEQAKIVRRTSTGLAGAASGLVGASKVGTQGGLITALISNTIAVEANTAAILGRIYLGWRASGTGAGKGKGNPVYDMKNAYQQGTPAVWNTSTPAQRMANYNRYNRTLFGLQASSYIAARRPDAASFATANRGSSSATSAATSAATGAVAVSGISKVLAAMAGFAKFVGYVTIIAAVVSAFSKLYGFKDIADMLESAILRITLLLKKLSKVFSAVTDVLAAVMIGMAAIMHGIFTGKMFTAKGRAEVKRDAQMAIDEFLKSRKDPLAHLPTQYMKSPKVQSDKIEAMASYAEKLRGFIKERKDLTKSDFGISRQKMSGKDISDNISIGMQDWQKSFAENQQKLIDLEADKAKADKDFYKKMIELTSKEYVTLQKGAEEAEEMAGVLGDAGQATSEF